MYMYIYMCWKYKLTYLKDVVSRVHICMSHVRRIHESGHAYI